tara:strand:+ start:85 stop:297 length:213 start_codon:yes stop_codon:yes gene_type:complete
MTKEDTIKLARDSGIELYGLGKDRDKFLHYIVAFAKLVAAAEREACAAMFDDHNVWDEEVGERIRARGTT